MPRPLAPLLVAITLLTLSACLPAEPAARGSGPAPPLVRPVAPSDLPPVRVSRVEGASYRAGRWSVTGVRADHGPPDPAELGERAERLARNLSRPRSRTPDSRLSKPRLAEPRVMKPRVSKPRVEPPGVSVGEGRVPGKRRPGPLVSVPDVRVYGDAVCVETPRSHVHIGRCRATPAPESTWHASQVSPPVVTPTPTPTKAEPTPTSNLRIVAARPDPPGRPNPLATVLLMAVLTTVIASATAVAFGAVK
ncbi:MULTISPECIES: hypothetical protein [Nonomuraea]|uniref:Uncharacterized protein n=1 Tax=Nonomuraea ferruginea TaxID=46174 RepID=A0ABT4SWP9_9ACTN|nr:hypothetical protein [Nonomuraea ferruginea]MDA0641261.1 hypothetical protein [Nonomuraea ferruginea]